jgi:hypothetical protein
MVFMDAEQIEQFETEMRHYPHRIGLEKRANYQVVWYFPEFYPGPWEGWDYRYGVCVC